MFSPKDGPLFQDGIVTWFVGTAQSIGIAGAKLSLYDRIAGKNPRLRRRPGWALWNKLICLSAFTAAGLWLLTASVNADTTSFATRGPWDAYIYAPQSRTLTPIAVYTTHGTVENPQNLLAGKPTRLVGSGSYLTSRPIFLSCSVRLTDGASLRVNLHGSSSRTVRRPSLPGLVQYNVRILARRSAFLSGIHARKSHSEGRIGR